MHKVFHEQRERPRLSVADQELLVQLLLEAGAPPSATGHLTLRDAQKNLTKGVTVLHMAVEEGHTGVVRLLLGAGADMSLRNPDGWPALHLAVHRHDAKVTQLLLSAGADVEAVTLGGSTPLMTAVVAQPRSGRANDKAQERWCSTVQQLLQAKPDLERQRLPAGDRALHMAAASGSTAAVQLLLAAGADVTAGRTNPGAGLQPLRGCSTVLELAALCGDAGMAQLVLSALEEAGSPQPVTMRVLSTALSQQSAQGLATFRCLLSYRQHKQHQLTLTDASKLQQEIYARGVPMGWQMLGIMVANTQEKMITNSRRLAALLFALCSGPASAGSHAPCTEEAVWRVFRRDRSAHLSKAMLEAWSTDITGIAEQHTALLQREAELMGVRAGLSCLALMSAADRKQEA